MHNADTWPRLRKASIIALGKVLLSVSETVSNAPSHISGKARYPKTALNRMTFSPMKLDGPRFHHSSAG